MCAREQSRDRAIAEALPNTEVPAVSPRDGLDDPCFATATILARAAFRATDPGTGHDWDRLKR
jgi:hypothetical protein